MLWTHEAQPSESACFYLIMLPWQRHIRRLNYQKVEVCVVNVLPFFATKGLSVLEEKVNETEVSKNVFSHLK